MKHIHFPTRQYSIGEMQDMLIDAANESRLGDEYINALIVVMSFINALELSNKIREAEIERLAKRVASLEAWNPGGALKRDKAG